MPSNNNIIITDIFGSKQISNDTPILIIRNLPLSYLTPHDEDTTEYARSEGIYNINIDKLHNSLEKKVQYINIFIPIGQVKINEKYGDTIFDTLLANTKLIMTTTNYIKLCKNEWIGIINKKDGSSLKSLSTIHSQNKPEYQIPVFPKSAIKIVDYMNKPYYDLYINAKCMKNGYRILNQYYFSGVQHKMIDTSGEIRSMYIPESSGETNRKVYYTTQGSVNSDTNCVSNDNDISINECNGTVNNDVIFGLKNKKSDWFNKKKTLVLKQRDEPWFLDANIVGDVLHTTDPHKVTGAVKVIGTIDDNTDEINMPFTSDCEDGELNKGYSRLDKYKKCVKSTEHYENMEGDNTILYSILSILILIFIIKRSSSNTILV